METTRAKQEPVRAQSGGHLQKHRGGSGGSGMYRPQTTLRQKDDRKKG